MMGKHLIVYYSRKGENYWNGSIKNLPKGNTEIVAEMIADITGGDLFQVETVKSSPADYYACIDEGSGMGISDFLGSFFICMLYLS